VSEAPGASLATPGGAAKDAAPRARRPSLIARGLRAARRTVRRWARRRQGDDPDPVVLSGRRIYILPTGLGVAFGVMIFAMFMGAMNYANNLALALALLLGALGLTAMYHCHRNLAGVRISSALTDPVFAGQLARFRIGIENGSRVSRHEISVGNEHGESEPVRIDSEQRATLEVHLPAQRRGYLPLEHFQISTRHPFGLFRAWSYLHMPIRCIVYPRPSDRSMPAPPLETDTGGAQDTTRGDEEFAGLRAFHSGDSPRRISWKAFAREQGLLVKMYAGTAVTSHLFDWNATKGVGVEARLSQLCRWIEDAHAAGRAYGLRMPGVYIPPNIGPAHRQRCLTALALFDGGET
jgi:uncharacterized protein (DUF58 family)